MSMPKSVVKVTKTKDGSQIKFIDNVDRVNYTIEELTKAALRDVGKVMKRYIKEATPVYTGLLKESWQTWVKKSKVDGHIELDIGVYSASQARKKGKSYAHHTHLVLFGHKMQNGELVQGNDFLTGTVQSNVNLIRDIEAQYLSAIEDENKARAIIEAEEGKSEDEE